MFCPVLLLLIIPSLAWATQPDIQTLPCPWLVAIASQKSPTPKEASDELYRRVWDSSLALPDRLKSFDGLVAVSFENKSLLSEIDRKISSAYKDDEHPEALDGAHLARFLLIPSRPFVSRDLTLLGTALTSRTVQQVAFEGALEEKNLSTRGTQLMNHLEKYIAEEPHFNILKVLSFSESSENSGQLLARKIFFSILEKRLRDKMEERFAIAVAETNALLDPLVVDAKIKESFRNGRIELRNPTQFPNSSTIKIGREFDLLVSISTIFTEISGKAFLYFRQAPEMRPNSLLGLRFSITNSTGKLLARFVTGTPDIEVLDSPAFHSNRAKFFLIFNGRKIQ